MESTTSQQNWSKQLERMSLTTICNKIRQTGEWLTLWTQSLVITLPKKGNLQQCQNYPNICLVNHPSKVMLRIILISILNLLATVLSVSLPQLSGIGCLPACELPTLSDFKAQFKTFLFQQAFPQI